MLKVTIELIPQGSEPAKRHLYSVEISNTNVDMTGNFGQYLATMVGEGIADEKPLAIKLRKFNRDQGAAKLTSRILSRFFRKYKALLSTPRAATPAQEVTATPDAPLEEATPEAATAVTPLITIAPEIQSQPISEAPQPPIAPLEAPVTPIVAAEEPPTLVPSVVTDFPVPITITSASEPEIQIISKREDEDDEEDAESQGLSHSATKHLA